MAVQRVAILAPMRSELGPLVPPLGLARSPDRGTGLFQGHSGAIEIVAALTGVGMDAAARRARQVLDAASPDHLVVVGIAGGMGDVAVGDLIVPDLVANLDTGERFRPAPLGDRSGRGTLASSDALLEDPTDAARLAREGIVAIDMETAAVASICEERGCPWSVFRAISDRADDGTTDAAVLSLMDAQGNPKPGAVARFVLTRPHRIPQLLRLARGSALASRVAAHAVVTALERLTRDRTSAADS